MRVRFHPAAELELSEAADIYDRENEGLGAKLIAKVRAATLGSAGPLGRVPDEAAPTPS
jgi:hypothetical protein